MEINSKIDYLRVESDETEILLNHHKGSLWKQYFAAMAACTLNVAVGSMIGWASSAVPEIMAGQATDLGGIEKISLEEASWVISLIQLGSLVGTLPIIQMIFNLGTKKFLLSIGYVMIIGWIFIIWNGNNVAFLYIGRILHGVASGANCTPLTMYLNEICCDRVRGRLGVLFDTTLVIGMLFSYFVSAITTLFWSSMLCLSIPIIYICMFYWMPESPVFLIKDGKHTEAVESLKWLHGEHCNIEKELLRINLALQEGKNDLKEDKENLSFIESVKNFINNLNKVTIKAFAIFLFLFLVQRSCGAPMIECYAVDVFQATRAKFSPRTATVLAGILELIFSFLGINLMDRIGRKILLRISLIVMTLCLGIYVAYMTFLTRGFTIEDEFGWISVAAICLFIGVFRLGLSPIPWFLGAELVPVDAQRWALPTIFFIGWSVAFMWSKSYLAAVATFGYEAVFGFFMFICMLGLLHTLVIPETKNKSRLEIQQALGAQRSEYLGIE